MTSATTPSDVVRITSDDHGEARIRPRTPRSLFAIGGVAQLVALPLAVLVLIVALGGLFVVRSSNEVAVDRDQAGRSAGLLRDVQSARLLAKGAANDERGFLLFGDEEFVAEFQLDRIGPLRELNEIIRSESTADVRALASAYTAQVEEWILLVEAELELVESDRDSALTFHTDVVRPARKTYEATGRELVAALESDVAESDTRLTASVGSARTAAIVMVAVVILTATVIGILLVRSIRRPLRRVADRAERIARGELVDDRMDLERHDEIGELGDSFDELTSMIAVVGRQARAIADGEISSDVLDARLPGDLGEAFSTMVESLKSMVEQLKTSSQQMGGAAQELTAVSASMGNSAEQTSARAASASETGERVSTSVATVAAAIEQMNESIRDVEHNATEAAGVASEAVEVAKATSTTIAKLGDSSAEIGNVVKVINSIAEQTNLLALNATIEAARAGEAGKGFAVVANEVKELANQTALATQEISGRIQAIQTDTSGAVEANEKMSETIDRINEISASIVAAVEQQSATTREIGRGIDEAASGTQTIAMSIHEVASNAENTRRSTDETSFAAEQMNQMSGSLDLLASRYT